MADLGTLVFTDCGVHVRDVYIPGADIASYLNGIPDADRVNTLVHAVQLGVWCLERAQTSRDVDFVKRQVEALLVQLAAIPETVQQGLISKLGTGDGQVLAPVPGLIAAAAKAVADSLTAVDTLFTDNLDPSKTTSVLGQALARMNDLLDAKRTDSIQGSFTAALAGATAADGVLLTAINLGVAEAVKPLAEQVDKLTKQVIAQAAADEVIARTTEKGESFEEELVVLLQSWARAVGAEIHHVGGDNQPGDIVVVMPRDNGQKVPWRIVVEARDRESSRPGRKRVVDTLTIAMDQREGDAAIYVKGNLEDFAQEIADWGEGSVARGPWVATTVPNLVIAVRFLWGQLCLASRQAAMEAVDAATIQAQVTAIRTSLRKVMNINRLVNEGRGAFHEIQEEAEGLRSEIIAASQSIEEALRASGGDEIVGGSRVA